MVRMKRNRRMNTWRKLENGTGNAEANDGVVELEALVMLGDFS